MESIFKQQFADMIQVIHILFLLLFIYLALYSVYFFFLSITGHLKKTKTYPVYPHKKKIALLITSYGDNQVIVRTATAATQHDYPQEYFNVFIAADRLSEETILQLKKLHLECLPVSFQNGSKARSLNYLLNYIPENDFDIVVVLDEDNILLPGFLEQINTAFWQGHRAVQGHRLAKNTDSPVATLDAVSEEINNHLFRRAQRTLGLSASLSGSGMAFEFKKLKEIYNKEGILDNPACDREVDFEMMKAGIFVEYIDGAGILDEKVSMRKVYRRQRRRWLESQIFHLGLFFNGKEYVPNKTKDYWNKLFVNLIPPRLFFLMIYLLVFLLSLIETTFAMPLTGISFGWWAGAFALYLLAMLISIPRHLYNRKFLRAVMYLPTLMLMFVAAAMGIRIKRKEFVHTPKMYTGRSGSTNS